MKFPVSLLLLAGVLSAPFAVSAQEAAGRVVVAAGDVTISRGSQKIAAHRGAEVRAGDTLQLGAQSNAQLLMTDETVISLKQDTQFRISEYAYQANTPDTGRAFFNLIKGGMRTVTGLIGKRDHANYRVNTLDSTIGIRGTFYSLAQCDNSCRNPDGSLAPNGTYGGVTDGRISVTNQTGETQFGHDQYFYVASITTAPQQLIAPPGFLRDKLEGRARSSGKKMAATGEQTKVQSQGEPQQQTSAPAGDPNIAASVSIVAPAAALTTNTFQVGNNAGNPGGITTLLQPTFTGTIFYRLGGTLNLVPTSCSTPPCNPFVLGEITLGINYAVGRATVSFNVQNSGGDILNYATPAISGGVPITISGNQVTFSGTFNRVDYPLNNGAFRCSNCGPGGTVGYADQLSLAGTINGTQATLTLSAVEPSGGGSVTVTLPQATPPNNSAAAMVLQASLGSTTGHASAAYWNVQLDSSGRLLDIGPLVGWRQGSVGTAVNTIVGSAPNAGNLVWGTWGAGAQITDDNYVTSITTQVLPWITGDATNSIPPSLGTQTYTVIPNGWVVNGSATNGTVNSGTLIANFVNQSINLSLNVTRNTGAGAGNTFQMNGVGGIVPTSSRFSQAFNTVTCSGGPCTGSAPTGGFGGFFAGSQAQGAGIAFHAGTGGLGQGVSGVVGMQR